MSKRSGFTSSLAGAAPSRLLARQPAPKAVTKTVEPKRAGTNAGITATVDGDFIVLRLPLFPKEKRRASGSGKSVLCASTHGPKIVRQLGVDGLVPVEIDGKALRVIASAFIPAADKVPSKESH